MALKEVVHSRVHLTNDSLMKQKPQKRELPTESLTLLILGYRGKVVIVFSLCKSCVFLYSGYFMGT